MELEDSASGGHLAPRTRSGTFETRPPAVPGPGALVTPSIRLVRHLAQGGMGSIWLAEHAGLATQVAVKLIDVELARQHPEVAERFRREAAASARIKSVHCVQVFDHGTTSDGVPYIVMELLDGASLDDRLEVEGTMSLRDTARIVSQLAKVLHRAHEVGVIHRDLKPENVFVVESDYELFVKLLDFGVAKVGSRAEGVDTRHPAGACAELTKAGVGIGTPGYVSPEQALNAKQADHRADLWSLGAVAYEMLTGALPFDTSDDHDGPWWRRLMRGELTPASDLCDELPPEIDDWFRRALDPDPAARFQTAREMATALLDIAGRERPSILSLRDTLVEERFVAHSATVPRLQERSPAPPAPTHTPAGTLITVAPEPSPALPGDAGSARRTLPSLIDDLIDETLEEHAVTHVASPRGVNAERVEPSETELLPSCTPSHAVVLRRHLPVLLVALAGAIVGAVAMLQHVL